jgi:ABC-type Fe3+/spermidine/putrescine transport system ATPase subunit
MLSHMKMTCFNNFYPFDTLPENFRNLEFSPLTILYGGNGCGKTTILNLIAEKLEIKRGTKINKSSFMEDYLLR